MAEMRARLESAQHILHHILTYDYRAEQTGMEIYDNKIRLDVRCMTNLTEIPKEEFEARINAVIKKGLAVKKEIYKRENVPKLINLDTVPGSARDIRVVSIGDYDIQPCANPHVDNTKEIGEYRIIEITKKGKDIYRIAGEVKDMAVKTEDNQKEFELSLAKGVRDFPPEEKILRDNIMNTIKTVFELYGYNPIELPILERYDTLAAKYAAGEASDALKEIFVTYDNGERKLGLRFDLTVPFSRFIGMNPELKMPFKKYVTGSVFRDGPLKKGRYREFIQFDPDVVGVRGVIADAEIVSITEEVFTRLGFNPEIEVNNRKIINGILEDLAIPEKDRFDVIVSIDKLKKIGEDGVSTELKEKGIPSKTIKELFSYIKKYDTNKDTLENLRKLVKSNVGKEGISEMSDFLDYAKDYGVKKAVFLPSLARGLAYYTGMVYEAFLTDSAITSSAAGGGRYDELIGKFLGGKADYPATGISFGVEVIVEALKEKQKLQKKSVTKIYVIPIKTTKQCIHISQQLRKAGINTDMDLSGKGISKNLEYANTYNIPYVLFAGEKELTEGKVKLRDMATGKEEMLTLKEAVERLS